MNHSNIDKARLYMRAAHSAYGQRRKFSGLPYYTHPEAVLNILLKHVPDADEDMQVATLLHDVLEDTKVTELDLIQEFEPGAVELVVGLTNRKCPGLNRAQQKLVDHARTASRCVRTRRIKLADRLHNLPDIILHDKSHAKVYVPETRHLLETALVGANDVMWHKLEAMCTEYETNQLTGS